MLTYVKDMNNLVKGKIIWRTIVGVPFKVERFNPYDMGGRLCSSPLLHRTRWKKKQTQAQRPFAHSITQKNYPLEKNNIYFIKTVVPVAKRGGAVEGQRASKLSITYGMEWSRKSCRCALSSMEIDPIDNLHLRIRKEILKRGLEQEKISKLHACTQQRHHKIREKLRDSRHHKRICLSS